MPRVNITTQWTKGISKIKYSVSTSNYCVIRYGCYQNGSNAPYANTSLTGTGSCSLPQMSPSEKRNGFGNENTRTYFVAVITHSIFVVAWLIITWYDIQSGKCKRRWDACILYHGTDYISHMDNLELFFAKKFIHIHWYYVNYIYMIVWAWQAADPCNNIFLSDGSFVDIFTNINNSKDPVNMDQLVSK